MNRQSWLGGFWARGAVIAILVLLAVVGFCLFEGDHDGGQHTSSIHVCSTMVVSSPTPTSVTALVVIGAAVMLCKPRVTAVTLGVPDPPPKLSFSL